MDRLRHPTALVESAQVGSTTRIGAFVHILPGATIGEACEIGDHVFIQNRVAIGHRVTIHSGVQVWDGVTIEDEVLIGPNATFTNDRFPRSGPCSPELIRTLIRRGATIGANTTILSGITIGSHAMVGGGAVVTKNVPPFAIVVGNPARIEGYVSTGGPHVLDEQIVAGAPQPSGALRVRGVRLYELGQASDLRGDLSYAEYAQGLPFLPQRFFLVYGVPGKEVRGEHAHRTLEQFLVCAHGSLSVVVDDGENRAEVLLDGPSLGLYVPPMVWAIQYKYSADAVLLVLASARYEAADYIRNYDEFLQIIEQGKPPPGGSDGSTS